MDDVFRCSPTNWSLCPANYSADYIIAGSPPDQYERPIAVLLGPACFSMGDINSYRLRYLSTVRTFGKPTAANLGWNERITNFPDWLLRYSKADMFHLNNPGFYLNRKESPIDYPIWFNPGDVSNEYDTVVEEALDWINRLAYGHNVITDMGYGSPGNDSIKVTATIENPNAHSLMAMVFVKDLNNTIIDSLELFEVERGELWKGKWLAANYEDFFKLDIKTTDQTTGESFTIENVNRITTAGPITIDALDISYLPSTDVYQVKPHIKNEGQTLTLENLFISMSSDDSTIISISGNLFVSSIVPGEIIIHPGYYSVKVDSNFSGEFRFDFEIRNGGWLFWRDSYPDSLVTFAENEITLPVSYSLYQNYPNPFNPSTTIKYQIPKLSFVTIKVYDVLGNEITTLTNEEKLAGSYSVKFNSIGLASGIYFYRIQADAFVENKKMILMK
jgi:hypothetical protein